MPLKGKLSHPLFTHPQPLDLPVSAWVCICTDKTGPMVEAKVLRLSSVVDQARLPTKTTLVPAVHRVHDEASSRSISNTIAKCMGHTYPPSPSLARPLGILLTPFTCRASPDRGTFLSPGPGMRWTPLFLHGKVAALTQSATLDREEGLRRPEEPLVR